MQSGPGRQSNQKRTIFKNVRTEDTVSLKVHMLPDASCVFPLAQPRSAGFKAVPNGLSTVIFKAVLQVFYITIRTKNLFNHIDFLKKIYIFNTHTVFCLHVHLHSGRGHPVSLEMTVSHPVDAEN